MRPSAIGGAALWAVLVVATGCSYAPDFPSDTLMCGPGNSCPEGYNCANGVTCWKNGDCAPSMTGSPADKFVGTWQFITPSVRNIVCDNIPMTPENVAGEEFVALRLGGPAPLRTDFFCDWDLNLDTSGTMTAIVPGMTCSGPDLVDPAITYTWRGEAFTLSTTDGRNGTLQISIPYNYTRPSGNGSCTMMYTATVTKECS